MRRYDMSKADVIEIEGTVVEKLPNTMFHSAPKDWHLPKRPSSHHPATLHPLFLR